LPRVLCRLALFHSAYANSYVNLAIFDRNSRELLREKIGEEAEELVYLFCIIPRHEVTFQRIMANGKIPENGMTVKHIISGEDVHLTPYQLAAFLVVSIADIADQWLGWMDDMFGNKNAEFIFGNNDSGTLWLGPMRPGLFLTFASRAGKIIRDAQIPNFVLPPIFGKCTVVLLPEKEIRARDLYWQVSTEFYSSAHADTALKLLQEAVELNPFVAEFYISLGQIFLQKNDWEKALESALHALKMLQEWGIAYDKRITWEAKVAWARVLIQQAKKKEWPTTPFGVLNLGLAK